MEEKIESTMEYFVLFRDASVSTLGTKSAELSVLQPFDQVAYVWCYIGELTKLQAKAT